MLAPPPKSQGRKTKPTKMQHVLFSVVIHWRGNGYTQSTTSPTHTTIINSRQEQPALHPKSKVYNTHSETHPWYGTGQGMGDACPRWIIQSNNLILAYKTQVQHWLMQHPTGLPALKQAIIHLSMTPHYLPAVKWNQFDWHSPRLPRKM